MEINVRDERKIIEIWLSNTEKQDAEIRERLKPIFKEYAARKYLVSVFESGGEDLCERTQDLLVYNRRKLAEAEALREKRRGQVMGT